MARVPYSRRGDDGTDQDGGRSGDSAAAHSRWRSCVRLHGLDARRLRGSQAREGARERVQRGVLRRESANGAESLTARNRYGERKKSAMFAVVPTIVKSLFTSIAMTKSCSG